MLSSFIGFLISKLLFFALHTSNAGSFPKPLCAAQEKEYLEKMKNGDAKAKEKLIEHNLRLVAHIVKKYNQNYWDQDDLISIGTIGLIKAVGSFDSEKGIRLATYAARCIENEILMHFRNMKKSSGDVFISDPIDIDSEGNPLTLIDIIATGDTIAEDLDLKIKIQQLRAFINEMKDEREKQIIQMRYGITGEEPLTQREVAAKLNISRSYISRIEKKALGELRKRFEKDDKGK